MSNLQRVQLIDAILKQITNWALVANSPSASLRALEQLQQVRPLYPHSNGQSSLASLITSVPLPVPSPVPPPVLPPAPLPAPIQSLDAAANLVLKAADGDTLLKASLR